MESMQKRDAANDVIEMISYQSLEAGIYRAKLEKITETVFVHGPTLIFAWRITTGECAGETFEGLCSKILSPKSKLTAWAKGHLGVTVFPENFTLQLSSLIGKEVHVTLSVAPRTDGQGERNVVEAVTPVRAPAPRRVLPQQVSPVPPLAADPRTGADEVIARAAQQERPPVAVPASVQAPTAQQWADENRALRGQPAVAEPARAQRPPVVHVPGGSVLADESGFPGPEVGPGDDNEIPF